MMELVEYAKEISSNGIQDLVEYSTIQMQFMSEFLGNSSVELVEYVKAIDYSKLDYTLISIISLFLLNFIVLMGIMSQKSKMSLLDSKLNTLINRPNKTPKIITRSMAPPPPPGPPMPPNVAPVTLVSRKESKVEKETESLGSGMSSVLEELSNFKRNVMESYMSPRASYLSKKTEKMPPIINGVVTRNKSKKIALEKAGEEAKQRISKAYLPKNSSPLRKSSFVTEEKENCTIMEKVTQKFSLANGTPYRRLWG